MVENKFGDMHSPDLERIEAMSYQREMGAEIMAQQSQHSPEYKVKSFLLTLLAPVVAVLGIGLLLAPSPTDIALAFKPIGSPLEYVAGGEDSERETISVLAERFKLAVGPELGANTDCFDDVRLADNSKLERCGRLIYQALAEVEKHPLGFPTDVAQSASPKELMQELKLAATEVCRERWSREGQLPAESPACEVAMAQPLDRTGD